MLNERKQVSVSRFRGSLRVPEISLDRLSLQQPNGVGPVNSPSNASTAFLSH
jgi:hypothetical protein